MYSESSMYPVKSAQAIHTFCTVVIHRSCINPPRNHPSSSKKYLSTPWTLPTTLPRILRYPCFCLTRRAFCSPFCSLTNVLSLVWFQVHSLCTKSVPKAAPSSQNNISIYFPWRRDCSTVTDYTCYCSRGRRTCTGTYKSHHSECSWTCCTVLGLRTDRVIHPRELIRINKIQKGLFCGARCSRILPSDPAPPPTD